MCAQIEQAPSSEIPDYLSDEYFRLRDQEKAYLEEARHFCMLAYNAETLEECLQLFDLAWKAEGQAFMLAWRTLESMARKNTPLYPPQGGNEPTPDPSQEGNTQPLTGGELAGEFEWLLAQEQRNFPVQDVYSLWTEDDRQVTLTFWLPRDRSLEELEEDIDTFLGNLERKARGFEIADQQESYTQAVLCCTAVFAAQEKEPQTQRTVGSKQSTVDSC